MPVKRDADGNIIEEKTRLAGKLQQAEPKSPGQSPAGVTVGPHKGRQADFSQQSGYEAQTVLARSGGSAARGDASDRDGKNQNIPAGKGRKGAIRRYAIRGGTQDVQSPENFAMDDPPVGWLVVVQGPGKGNAMTIGNGSNSIGRDPDERICINFGDEMISRQGHSTITYDPRGKTFYIQHGAGKNLTYLEGNPVLSPTELAGFSRIMIGNTLLLFVPLCCERFDWEEYVQ